MRQLLLAGVLVAGLPCAASAQILAQVGGVTITLQEVIAADPAAAKDNCCTQ